MRVTMSSRVASRTTLCGESAPGRRFSSRAENERTTVPTAGPLSAYTTTCWPGIGGGSVGGSAVRNVCARPTGVSFTETSRSETLTATFLYSDRLGARGSGLGTRDALELQHEPIRHDLDAGIPLQRHQRPIDRRKRAHAALALIRARQTLERRLHVWIGEGAGIRAG